MERTHEEELVQIFILCIQSTVRQHWQGESQNQNIDFKCYMSKPILFGCLLV